MSKEEITLLILKNFGTLSDENPLMILKVEVRSVIFFYLLAFQVCK